MNISSKDLPELAGWQAMKKARLLVAAGSVMKAGIEGGGDAPLLIRGLVVEGRRKTVCGLRIRSLSDADNLCSCSISRRDGGICEHSIAVALSALDAPKKGGGESSQTAEAKVIKTISPQIAWLPTLLKPLGYWDGKRPVALRLAVADPGIEWVEGFQERLLARWREFGVRLSAEPQLLSLPAADFLILLEDGIGDALPIAAGGKSSAGVEHLTIAETLTRLPMALRVDPEREESVFLRRPRLDNTLFLGGDSHFWIVRTNEQLAIRVPVQTGGTALRRRLVSLLECPSEAREIVVDINWLREHLDHLHCMFHMECSDELIDTLRVVRSIPTVALAIEGSLKRIDLKMAFSYQAGEQVNAAFEEAAFKRIPRTGERPQKEASSVERDGVVIRKFQFFIRGEEAILDFYAGGMDRLISEGQWQVEIGERFAGLTRQIEKVRPRCVMTGTGAGWLDFDLSFASEGGAAIPEAEIRRLLATGQSVLKLADGRKAAIDRSRVSELYDSLSEANSENRDVGSGSRRVSGSQSLYVKEVIDEFTSNVEPEFDPELVDFTAKLRIYQRQGVAWMYQRIRAGHGAILADEMGLGKTVQSLALIAAKGGERSAPVLVVCPTSMLRTWEREAQRFVPEMTTLVLHGAGRAGLFQQISTVDIVITSYGSLVRDIERYPEIEFRLAFADEASFIKNPRTQTAKAARKIAAVARIALTGTPIENSIQDIWSIMEFTNPGYLGRREDFVARHAAGGEDAARRLRRRLSPYLLRRTKREVASDLPAKLERVIYCELGAKQRVVYERLLRESRESIRSIAGAGDWQSSQLQVLTVLLRLRQTCCDLRLLGGAGAVDADSAKLAAFDTLVSDALAGGHRILVFSQFVSMLSLLREHLDRRGHRYAYLDGSTPAARRAAQVEAFQTGDDLPIFLISLKAGGYGLTLTKADTVIHFDPWWNPAVEAQATDRAHRIGQTNPVTAYKLIASGTVEEKILRLQQRKRDLVAGALDEQRPLMSALSREDIEFVLS